MHMITKEECEQWAIGTLHDPCTVILETETTGLSKDAQVIEIGVIDTSGEVLFDSYIQPTIAVTPEAFNVHCISNDILQFAPSFGFIYPKLEFITKNKTIISYNHLFEERVLSLPCLSRSSVRDYYSAFIGNWSDTYGNNKWRSLSGKYHTALEDCYETLSRLKEMSIWGATKNANPSLHGLVFHQ